MCNCEACLQRWFPNIPLSDLTVTSDQTDEYNCHAWAMCDTERQWGHPGNLPGWKYSYHWPAGVPNDATKEAYIAAYATEGFVECDHGDLEEGFVKIALYENDNSIQHTARLLSTGVWSSKLGDYWDISHAKAESVEGDTNDPDRYGKPVAFMKRPRKPEDDEYEKATFTCVGACPYP